MFKNIQALKYVIRCLMYLFLTSLRSLISLGFET